MFFLDFLLCQERLTLQNEPLDQERLPLQNEPLDLSAKGGKKQLLLAMVLFSLCLFKKIFTFVFLRFKSNFKHFFSCVFAGIGTKAGKAHTST